MSDQTSAFAPIRQGAAHGWPARLYAAVYYLAWAFLFLNPFPYGESVKEICYYTAITFFVGLAVTGRAHYRFRAPVIAPLLVYGAWVVIGVAAALDRSRSFHDFLSHWVKYIGLFFIITNYWGDRRQLARLAWTFSVAAVVFSTVAMIYFYGFSGSTMSQPFGAGFKNAAINVIGYTTLFGALLMFQLLKTPDVLPAKKYFLQYGLWACMAASVLTQSRGTLLAMLAAFFVISRRKSIVLVLFLVTVVIVFMTPLRDRITNPVNYEDRIFRIYYSWELIKDHPVTGTGFSLDALKDPAVIDDAAYRARLPEAYRDFYQEYILPHSLLLNVPVRTGLVGAVLFAAIFIPFARTGWRLARRGKDPFVRSWSLALNACMVMYLVKGAFEPVDTAPVEVIFFTILAMQAVLWRIDEETPAAVEGGDR